MGDGAARRPTISWLVIDNELLFLRLVLLFFAQFHPHIRHIGEGRPEPARSRRSGVQLALRYQPEVVLVDLKLLDTDDPGQHAEFSHGAACIEELAALARPPSILAISAEAPDPGQQSHRELWKRIFLKVKGGIVKDVEPDYLATAIETVACGFSVWSPGTLERVASCLAVPNPIDECAVARLTPGEHRVMEAAATLPNPTEEEIAAAVSYEKNTVHAYLGRLYDKTKPTASPVLLAGTTPAACTRTASRTGPPTSGCNDPAPASAAASTESTTSCTRSQRDISRPVLVHPSGETARPASNQTGSGTVI